jgi:cytochrome c553
MARRLGAALLLLAAPAAADAPPPGASSCSGCHAMPVREGAAIPSLAGLDAGRIAAALLAYRRGEGAPTVMNRIARGFTEAEIRAIADWIAAR